MFGAERRLVACLTLLLVLGAGPCAKSAPAHPFGVDDLLQLESVGHAFVDPNQHWLVIERRDPYSSGERFDYDDYVSFAISRLWVVNLYSPGAPRPLLDPTGRGYVAGPFSPDGRSMAVFRLVDRTWSLGVVTMATGTVTWLDVTPEYAVWGPTVLWRSNTEILAITRPDHSLPWHQRYDGAAQARLPILWNVTAEGQRASVSEVGSGAYRDRRARAVPDELTRLNLATGAHDVLARGEFHDMSLSASGRYLALARWGGEIDPVGVDALRVYTPARRRRLTLIDLRTDRVLDPCPGCDLISRLLAWAPDRDRLMIFARPDQDLNWDQGRLRIVDPAAGTNTVESPIQPEVIESRDDPQMVRADWLAGAPIIYGRRKHTHDRPDWYRLVGGRAINLTHALPAVPILIAARDGETLSFAVGDHIWRVDARGDAKASHDPMISARFTPSSQGDRAEFEAPGPVEATISTGVAGRRRLVFRPKDGPQSELALNAETDLVAVAPENGFAVLSERDAHGVQRLRLASARKPSLDLMTLNPQLEGFAPAQVRPIEHVGPRGEALVSWLYLPPDWRPGERPPVIVCPYPGLVHATAPAYDAPGSSGSICNAQVLAGQGYGVLIPSLPPSISPPHEPMQGVTGAILGVVDAAIARGYADPNRLALWGHSFGGMTALMVATQTHRFKAIIESAGISDLISQYSAVSPAARSNPEEGLPQSAAEGYAEAGQGDLETPPWVNPQRYIRNSPLFAADRIATPLLMIHGDMDLPGASQGEAMFAALHRQGKDGLLLTYWGESHIPMSPGNIRDIYAHVFEWLDHYLGGSGAGERQAQSMPMESPGMVVARSRGR